MLGSLYFTTNILSVDNDDKFSTLFISISITQGKKKILIGYQDDTESFWSGNMCQKAL